jgi:hypothetical protein
MTDMWMKSISSRHDKGKGCMNRDEVGCKATRWYEPSWKVIDDSPAPGRPKEPRRLAICRLDYGT